MTDSGSAPRKRREDARGVRERALKEGSERGYLAALRKFGPFKVEDARVVRCDAVVVQDGVSARCEASAAGGFGVAFRNYCEQHSPNLEHRREFVRAQEIDQERLLVLCALSDAPHPADYVQITALELAILLDRYDHLRRPWNEDASVLARDVVGGLPFSQAQGRALALAYLDAERLIAAQAAHLVDKGERGSYREARGAVPLAEGDPLPEDTIRRLRD